MSLFAALFGLPLLCALGYNVLALFLACRFTRAHASPDSDREPVTVLRPLHGADASTYENLASVCVQNPPPAEIRYGVDGSEDPAIGIVERINKDYSCIPSRLEVGLAHEAPNRKMANLARLAAGVRTPILASIDQDIFTEPDHLTKTLNHFHDPKTGMVTCLYRIGKPETFGSAMELLSVHADFFPLILVGEFLEGGLGFAFGATMALRTELLKSMGGFQNFWDYLADDYQLGARVCEMGYKVVLSNAIAEHRPGKLSLGKWWKREIRSARTHRVCRPGGYAASIFTQGLPWIGALAAAGLLSGFWLQVAVAWGVARGASAMASHAVLSKGKGPWWPMLFLPAREVLRFVFWICAFTGATVLWGEAHYQVFGSGKMRKLAGD